MPTDEGNAERLQPLILGARFAAAKAYALCAAFGMPERHALIQILVSRRW